MLALAFRLSIDANATSADGLARQMSSAKVFVENFGPKNDYFQDCQNIPTLFAEVWGILAARVRRNAKGFGFDKLQMLCDSLIDLKSRGSNDEISEYRSGRFAEAAAVGENWCLNGDFTKFIDRDLKAKGRLAIFTAMSKYAAIQDQLRSRNPIYSSKSPLFPITTRSLAMVFE